jgi:serine/threonine protein kinase
LSRSIKRNANQHHNNNHHTDYYHFVKTAHFLPNDIEGFWANPYFVYFYEILRSLKKMIWMAVHSTFILSFLHLFFKDFGMSPILEKADEGRTNSSVGPVCWMAPESISRKNYSKKSDVWTFGIVVYEIVAQCEPHKDMDLVEVAVQIRLTRECHQPSPATVLKNFDN